MEKVIGISFGELALKGKNRGSFENQLIKKIRFALKTFSDIYVYRDQGKMYVSYGDGENHLEIIDKLKNVFGIVYISYSYKVDKSIEAVRKAAVEMVKEELGDANFTFRVNTKRVDKYFPMKSMEVSADVGGYILENTDNTKVNLSKPEHTVFVDIRTEAYVYINRVKGCGGLPVGTNGKGLVLLSGGIDSPVAAFMMAKRGVKVDAIHFHSYPYTSERAEEKVKDLAKIMTLYCGSINFHSINLLEIQKAIGSNCPEDEMTIISRRFMMRIAEKIANTREINALITGESLGQVASQTIFGLNVTNSSVQLPVFRPLIGMDKTEIIEIAKQIETFETSIQPFEDCCTVFLPKHPVTRPKLEDIEKSEENLNVEELIDNAISSMKVCKIK